MDKQKWKKCIGLMIVICIGMVSASPPFQTYASFPSELRLFAGQSKQIHFSMPVSALITLDDPEIIQVNGEASSALKMSLNDPISLSSAQAGQAEMNVKLFGTIPFKKVKINVVPELRVIPGGQTIGVKIKSKGVLVVGHHMVVDSSKDKHSPGQQAGILMGDLITHINGEPLQDISQVAEYAEKAGKNGKPLTLTIQRGDQQMDKKLMPAKDEDHHYRLGLYIRDSAAGVGTLTFYAPDHQVYGALGHVITDLDTHTPIPVGDGEIVHSTVTSISRSENGSPGEKRAHFFKEKQVLGNITNNTQFGIFGNMKELPEYGKMNQSIPVAFSEEVKEGPAQILTVVEGNKVEKYNIEIVHAAKQDVPATKGLVIKITDKKLIEKTGGIVQGMSGSPIIQDGKLVGAVTHVFVNDPTSGYGCYIEWMLQDAGISIRSLDSMSEIPKAS